MGSPSGLARASTTPAARNPATAASVAAVFKNSRLESTAIARLLFVESALQRSAKCRVWCHNSARRRDPPDAIDRCGLIWLRPRPVSCPEGIRAVRGKALLQCFLVSSVRQRRGASWSRVVNNRRKWRVAILGLGHWYSAYGLARTLREYPRAELVAAAWDNKAQLDAFSSTFGVTGYGDYDE